jgi:hypothetical protein
MQVINPGCCTVDAQAETRTYLTNTWTRLPCSLGRMRKSRSLEQCRPSFLPDAPNLLEGRFSRKFDLKVGEQISPCYTILGMYPTQPVVANRALVSNKKCENQ